MMIHNLPPSFSLNQKCLILIWRDFLNPGPPLFIDIEQLILCWYMVAGPTLFPSAMIKFLNCIAWLAGFYKFRLLDLNTFFCLLNFENKGLASPRTIAHPLCAFHCSDAPHMHRHQVIKNSSIPSWS